VDVNRPDVVAEVAKAFAEYEDALVANDVERLSGFFWDTEQVVRFGIDDHQTGATELRRWRNSQPSLPPGRTLTDTMINTFDTDVAVVTTRFSYPGTTTVGRQSQTWVRLPEGWRVVSAHVSEPRYVHRADLPEGPGEGRSSRCSQASSSGPANPATRAR
jgi:1-carboxybiuret hydrolase subunit AtzH-like protein